MTEKRFQIVEQLLTSFMCILFCNLWALVLLTPADTAGFSVRGSWMTNTNTDISTEMSDVVISQPCPRTLPHSPITVVSFTGANMIWLVRVYEIYIKINAYSCSTGCYMAKCKSCVWVGLVDKTDHRIVRFNNSLPFHSFMTKMFLKRC